MKRMAVIVVALLSISACSMLNDWIYGNPPRTKLRQITVMADPAANVGNATMLDIVFVYETTVLSQLPQNGPEWFRKKEALKKMFPIGIDIVVLQIPSGSSVFNVEMPKRFSKAIGVYVLSNYVAEGGQPIANLTQWRRASIHLLPETINYNGD